MISRATQRRRKWQYNWLLFCHFVIKLRCKTHFKNRLSVVGGVLLALSHLCRASRAGGVVEDSYSYHDRRKHCDRTQIGIIYSQQPSSLAYFLRVLHQLPPPPQIESAVNNQSLTSYSNHIVVPVASKRPVTLSNNCRSPLARG